MGSVARAEPAVVLTSAGDGHAAQVCADTQHNQPVEWWSNDDRRVRQVLVCNIHNVAPRSDLQHFQIITDRRKHQHLPLSLLDAVNIGLRVLEGRERDGGLLGDLVGGSVSNKYRLSSPLHGQRGALGDASDVELGRGQGQHIGGRTHGGDELKKITRMRDRR